MLRVTVMPAHTPGTHRRGAGRTLAHYWPRRARPVTLPTVLGMEQLPVVALVGKQCVGRCPAHAAT